MNDTHTESKQAENDSKPSMTIEQFVDHLNAAKRLFDGTNQRAEVRYPLTYPVGLTPLDRDGNRNGKPFDGVLRDISCHGISLLAASRTENEFLALEFRFSGGVSCSGSVEVSRCRRVGPLWEIAGPFYADPTA